MKFKDKSLKFEFQTLLLIPPIDMKCQEAIFIWLPDMFRFEDSRRY